MSLVDIKAHLRMVKIAVLDWNWSAVTQKRTEEFYLLGYDVM
jgi:hypothetical protein